jgi:hypothetical protein
MLDEEDYKFIYYIFKIYKILNISNYFNIHIMSKPYILYTAVSSKKRIR